MSKDRCYSSKTHYIIDYSILHGIHVSLRHIHDLTELFVFLSLNMTVMDVVKTHEYRIPTCTVDLLDFHADEGIIYFNLFNSFTMTADVPPFLITCTVCVFFNFKCR